MTTSTLSKGLSTNMQPKILISAHATHVFPTIYSCRHNDNVNADTG